MTNRLKYLKSIFINTSYLNNKNRNWLKIKSIKNDLKIKDWFEKRWKRIAKKLREQKLTTQLFYQNKSKPKSLLTSLLKKRSKSRENTCKTRSNWLSNSNNFNELMILISERNTNIFLISKTRSRFENLSEHSNHMKVLIKCEELQCMTWLYLHEK